MEKSHTKKEESKEASVPNEIKEAPAKSTKEKTEQNKSDARVDSTSSSQPGSALPPPTKPNVPPKSSGTAEAAKPSTVPASKPKSNNAPPKAIPATRQPIAQTASLASELITAAAKKKVIISRPYASAAGLMPSSTATVRHPIISTKPNGSMQASKAIIAEATAAAAASQKNPALIVPPVTSKARPVPARQPAKPTPSQSGVVSAPISSVSKKKPAGAVGKTTPKSTLPKPSTSQSSSSSGNTAGGKKRKAPATSTGSSAPASKASSSSSNSTKVPRLQQQSAAKSPVVASASPAAMPLADPEIVQLVESILTLLQLYGPLNRGQLEFNLPPVKSSNKHLLTDVLELLVTIGVVKKITKSRNKGGTGSNTPQQETIQQQQHPPLYCIFGGTPRSDVLMPQTIWSEIDLAQGQGRASLERCGRLRRILEETTHQKKHPREALTQLLRDYPEIRDDPVFVAGLRNLQVDMSSSSRHKK